VFRRYPNYLYEANALIKDYYFAIDFIAGWLENSATYFKEYELEPGDTPESISSDQYGSTQYWFLILLANAIDDPFFGWKLSDEECRELAILRVADSQVWDDDNPVEVAERAALVETTFAALVEEYASVTIMIPSADMVKYMYDQFMTECAKFKPE
jgi:hypothetical protein